MGQLSVDECLLDKVYATATEPSLWAEVQRRLADAVGAIGSMYYLYDKLTRQFVDLRFVGYTAALGSGYQEHYHELDPHVDIACTVPERKWFASHEYLDDGYVSRSEYFVDFQIPAGIRHVLGTRLWETDRIQAALAFQRGVDQQPFTRELCAAMDALSAHLARASRMQYRLHEASVSRELSAAALDSIDSAVCVLDAARRVVYANAKAEEILRRGSILSVKRGGILHACNSRSDEELHRAITHAREGRTGGVQLLGKSGPATYNAAVARLRENRLDHAPGESVRVLLVMTTAHMPRSSSDAMLQQMFGLTHAEAQLAQALADGESAEDYADRSCRSLATIRTQMRSIYAKTNVGRLSELLLLLGSLPHVVE